MIDMYRQSPIFSLVTNLVGSLEENPLAVKLLDNRLCIYISVLILHAGQLGSPEKCTSRLEGNKGVSNCTNLIRVSNKYYHKYYCVVLVLLGKPIS